LYELTLAGRHVIEVGVPTEIARLLTSGQLIHVHSPYGTTTDWLQTKIDPASSPDLAPGLPVVRLSLPDQLRALDLFSPVEVSLDVALPPAMSHDRGNNPSTSTVEVSAAAEREDVFEFEEVTQEGQRLCIPCRPLDRTNVTVSFREPVSEPARKLG